MTKSVFNQFKEDVRINERTIISAVPCVDIPGVLNFPQSIFVKFDSGVSIVYCLRDYIQRDNSNVKLKPSMNQLKNAYYQTLDNYRAERGN